MKWIRVTRHLPLTGDKIGLTVWYGTRGSGWTGYPVFKRGRRWSLKGVPAPHVSKEHPE